MGLTTLIIGLIVLLGAHVFVTFRGARAKAIEQVGQIGYRILFTLVSLAGLALIAAPCRVRRRPRDLQPE